MGPRTRVAAIGASHWHAAYDPAYLRQLHSMPDVEIVGIQDEDTAVAAERGTAFGNPPVYADIAQMLDTVSADFVLALGRHDRMAATANLLLDRGLPFLMEKPMGLNGTEVQQLSDKARDLAAFVAVPMPMRFSPFFSKAQEMIREGRFGKLSHVYMRMNRFSSERYVKWNSEWMLDPAKSGGGALRNLGAHGFDLFRALTGENVRVIAAQTSNRALGQAVEDYASVLFRSETGVVGTLEVGNAYPRKTVEGVAGRASGSDKLLDGADGEFKICGSEALLVAKDGEMKLVEATQESVMPGFPEGNPSFRIIEDALSRWRQGLEPAVSVHDCLAAVRPIDEAYRLAAATAG